MPKKKILLADDSRTALIVERALLVGSPYDVIVATDGYDAVQQALEAHPDLIILDVVIPKHGRLRGDGWRLRQLDPTRDTPIIMVTTRRAHNVESGLRGRLQRLRDQADQRPRAAVKVRNLLGE
jgi:CheY-like chemotaxis protein